MRTTLACWQIQSLTGLLGLAMFAKLRLDNGCSGTEEFSEWLSLLNPVYTAEILSLWVKTIIAIPSHPAGTVFSSLHLFLQAQLNVDPLAAWMDSPRNTHLMNLAVNIINSKCLAMHYINCCSAWLIGIVAAPIAQLICLHPHTHSWFVPACVLPVLSAALHVQGRAPGWGRARQRARATHLPCL